MNLNRLDRERIDKYFLQRRGQVNSTGSDPLTYLQPALGALEAVTPQLIRSHQIPKKDR